MRILNCLVHEHDWNVLFLALAMCVFGAHVSITLFRRALATTGSNRNHWVFLAAVTAGAATWATHFIAMLGYQVNVPVSFNGPLTIASALIAVFGIAIGLFLASRKGKWTPRILGGGTIGLAIAAMHYSGMFAYRVEGIVRWDAAYVVASIVLVVALGILLIASLQHSARNRAVQVGVLVAAIASLHFTGMTAFSVTPLPGVGAAANSEAYLSMASAIALVALLIMAAGLSTNLVERRTYTESQDELEHIAMHDALTGLSNRHSFTKALEREAARLSDQGAPFALLMIDLDRFKAINDTLGHPTGDAVLKKVAKRLRCAVRREDLVARMGGDEFSIILNDLGDEEMVKVIADRVVEILRRPILVNGNVVEIGGSAGIAMAPRDGEEPQQLIQHGDIALYTAKRAGRERHCFFEPKLLETMSRRRMLEVDLRRACMRDDFRIRYQPVIDAVSKEVTGVEALLRWNCEGRGDVPPSDFIPVAEELGLVSRIGAGVLRQACKDVASWPGELDLAVNISPVQLLDPRLNQTVRQALEESGLPASRLELEITETALLGNDELAFATLQRLQEMGVRVALDDFGTGYSSLSYLHRFPINRIKIDRSFVQKLPNDAGSASIVRAIAQLGESLNLKITAEGIETEEQFAFIADHGCGQVQGFLVSRPVSSHDMQQLLKDRASARVA